MPRTPRSLTSLTALAAATFLTAQSSRAEVPESALEAARGNFGGRTPSLIYSTEDLEGWGVVSIYDHPFDFTPPSEPAAAPVWLARFAKAGEGGSAEVTWADSRSCPGLEGVLWSVTRISPPRWEVPGLTRARPKAGVRSIMLSSAPIKVEVWGRGLQGGGQPAEVSVSALGGELGQWATDAAAALSSCWSSQIPTK